MTNQSSHSQSSNPLWKDHFYITRNALKALSFSDEWLPAPPSSGKQSPFLQAEQQIRQINAKLKHRFGEKAEPRLPAQYHGMKLLHLAGHFIISRLVVGRNPDFLNRVEESAQEKLADAELSEYLSTFISLFPPPGVFKKEKTAKGYLASASNRQNILEESLFVWLQNQNPALDQFSFLLSDNTLRDKPAYRQIVETFLHALREMGPIGPGNIDPTELLTQPMRHAPNSILEQLRYIRLHWRTLLEGSPLLDMIDSSITLIQDEDAWLFFEKTGQENLAKHGGFFEKEAQAPSFGDLGDEPENYSVDSSWMPEVIMLAKSTFVWLDQLSKTYKRPIHRLQDIPDRELDTIAERGFTALWLIGLWERSPASRKIKHIQGNPEALSSAYALDGYEIADELGGHEGYLNLRHRALQRGIRLASDMVPNHTGLDSRLVKEKPEWFISSYEPPYLSYTYNGPNLSSDPRFGIYIEDGYWNRTDAAVTFKRIDYHNGDTRYIYHGNDGTTMPWNDTAQLNFLSAEVREAVIQQILHVARMFPVIRFDAAMVLVKRHIQRLWYPLPGHMAGIPSRSSHAISMEDFNKFIPEEFWREVVDRIHAEAPDTLLLAEAFWMLEGYFVRTLGMHRVYNSAFMHMLKKEDNAGYRYLIKNTLEFDAGILKRYVNFMNNPDEDTAVEQFGKGDKYFGVCAMMATMPGLPMFGHGQIEGFGEKYGMEYARAYLDEHPDEELVKRHEREIFPLLKKRYLFAEVERFFLYDVYSDNGAVNENVFCYSNQSGKEKALVAYNNAWEQATGHASMSVGFKTENGIEQRSLCDGLGLSDNPKSFVIFRDHLSNLEYIRQVSRLREEGMHVVLGGYRYNVFLDFREVTPSRLLPYDRLCESLNGGGAASMEKAALEISLAPLYNRIAHFCSQANLDELFDNSLDETAQRQIFEQSLSELLQNVSQEYGILVKQEIIVPDHLAERACLSVERSVALEAALEKMDNASELLESLGITDKEPGAFSQLTRVWIVLESLENLLRHHELLHRGILDDLLLAEPVAGVLRENRSLQNFDPKSLTDLFRSLLSLKPPVTTVTHPAKYLVDKLTSILETDDGATSAALFLSIQKQHNKHWFSASRFSMMLAWLCAVTLLYAWPKGEEPSDPLQGKEALRETLEVWIEAMEQTKEAAFIAGYEIDAFVKNMRKLIAST